jgi:hypothetical protein
MENIEQEKPKQIKCYCGHTTYCDCGPLEVSDEAKQRAKNYMSLKGALESKQETLEEAAENYADKQSDISMRQNPLEYSKSGEELWYESKVDFIEGAKWQAERMYSEDDLREAFKQSRNAFIFEEGMPPVYKSFEEWFEQFKKK